ncbi:MAG: hypothetical protein JOZ24_01390 [Candidatus Eremiobacteraeota bacterium]|nr:hypothetical protein [Candidatus Eremiobacteraeota bacterium]
MSGSLLRDGDIERLVLLRWVHALAALGRRPLRFRLLRPTFPALGVGTLRTLRVLPVGEGGAVDVVAGYERYERL